jgi:hypothetical protein
MKGLTRAKERLRVTKNFFRGLVGLPPRRDEWFVEFVVRDRNCVQFYFNDAHQSRQEATTHMILDALKTIKYEVRKNHKVTFYTSDHPPPDPAHRVLSYSALKESKNVVAVPDFSFWSWPDVGILDYSQTVDQVLAASEHPPQDERLFWIGNTATSPMRTRLMEIAAQDPRILATDVTWVKEGRAERWASEKQMDTLGSNYVSLPDHCRYKYLIDVEGIGYSARLKLLLFSARPLFLQERPCREFYFDRIKPFSHYIPVDHDLSNLSAQLDWAQAHPDECAQIAANAQAFARQHLTREAAIIYLREAIVELLA